ncbi:probable leucine-rich repeat receptor-like serine/threonine-protein kinase At3g14840 isoform X2 [Prosopis cineraria]|uniref:probable leucine-rich repeat receptor-like serine/threonine-protein kinase At3g14840 isoform X2 n=1 Tax=Prosopis cineraria TaxID=364024 RepID=UPI00240FE547|nr:probable leucine-rich repeat receptor-like serine/threonine-protein kinase At3g14840 isoform X2 [Prosopis cineraria]
MKPPKLRYSSIMKIITFPHHHLFLLMISLFWASSAFGATKIHPSEMEALKDIAKTLGKTDWNFSIDPCDTPSAVQSSWFTPNPVDKESQNAVVCNCTLANDSFCHVVNITLKKQSLPGKLPPELVRLSYLSIIDLSRNYLSGSIPSSWAYLKLVHISLLGNRLTGRIPVELTKITTLQRLVLEFNQFYGNLPPELGNLRYIEGLLLTSNNFTGEIPSTFANLTTLTDIRLGDNQFSGKMPSFIQNWKSLETIVAQGSGLSGPISGISFPENLKLLTISDLNGPDSTFPALNNLTKLKSLILRSCNIIGKIPPSLGSMGNLKILDLSFNKLQGKIPDTFSHLSQTDDMYLTGNFLDGPVPALNKVEYVDLSYNNFSSRDTGGRCDRSNVNLFGDSLTVNDSGSVTCMRSPCSKTWYSVNINCGGKAGTFEGKMYDGDLDLASRGFAKSGTNWAISNTGHFIDARRKYTYIAESNSLPLPNVELYGNARLSPISLTYYVFCLGNGPYTVSLHFVEIVFTDDQTYRSLGRRVFDVYIQGKRMLKDFNIVNEAGGAGKLIVRNFTVNVTSGTLEIRFSWAGKGTTAIPEKSVYGPLISAISVTSDFKPPRSMPGAVVAAIVAAGVSIVILILGMLWWRGILGKRSSLAIELKSLDLQTGSFTLRQIKAATNNFDASNKIGEGGFGSVYKGFLSDGTMIAVKQLSSKSKQGNREFINEIGMISALQHPCLVKLHGCCAEGDQLLLVYEYMENNSLARALFGPEECRLKLDWPTRQKICVGIARGLAFLHEESRLKIVHRDIKATNVLLDKDLNAKISDFGLAKLDEEENTHISTRIAGTYGYMAPEYAMHGYLTDKADVYSFGIVALEIVSGRSNTYRRQKEDCFNLLNWAHVLKENDYLMELVDPRLGSDFNREEVMVMINVALLCTNPSSSLRPPMSSVLSMLEGRTVVAEFISDQSVETSKMKLETTRQYYRQIEENQTNDETETHSQSLLGMSTSSSTSARDLYPVRLDSSYLEKRKSDRIG